MSGFSPETFEWFEGLQLDNSKAYFQAHRDVYDGAVRGPLELLLEDLADELGGVVKMFRPYRDTRFSADKSPYKTTAYGVIHERADSHAPLYAQLSAQGLFAGTGYYRIANDQLTRLREAVLDDRHGPELERIVAGVEAAGVEVFGAALKTAPRGYPRDHPRIRLLRHNMLMAGQRLSPGRRGIPAGRASDHLRHVWEACLPMNVWLDRHVGPSELEPSPRFRTRR